jgi:hypothetical protein
MECAAYNFHERGRGESFCDEAFTSILILIRLGFWEAYNGITKAR